MYETVGNALGWVAVFLILLATYPRLRFFAGGWLGWDSRPFALVVLGLIVTVLFLGSVEEHGVLVSLLGPVSLFGLAALGVWSAEKVRDRRVAARQSRMHPPPPAVEMDTRRGIAAAVPPLPRPRRPRQAARIAADALQESMSRRW